MSYGEIRALPGNISTGKLNYHLKVMGSLIFKNPETGPYSLAEEGFGLAGFPGLNTGTGRLSSRTRMERAKAVYILAAVSIATVSYISHELLKQLFPLYQWIVIFMYSYMLLIYSHYVWKRATI